MKLLSEGVIIHGVLALVQLASAGSSVLSKAVLNNGMNPYVFAVYTHAMALPVLLFLALLMERGKRPRSYPLVILLCVACALTGIFGSQLLFLTGLSLSSVQLAAAIMITIPIFTYIIAAIFRTDEIGLLKAGGVAFSVGGAAVMTLFRGPAVISQGNATSHFSILDLHTIWNPEIKVWNNTSITDSTLHLANWQIGCLLVLASCICGAATTNIQVPLLARYPAPVSISSFTFSIETIIILLVSWFKIEDSSLWTLKNSTDIIAIVYTGTIPIALAITFQAWCVHKAGPIIVISYAPMQTLLSAILGMIFLKETLHLGNIIGAVLVSLGLYLVIWGQQRDRSSKISVTQTNNLDSVSDSQTSLLEHGVCAT